MISADTNLLLYAADPDSPHHASAREFFNNQDGSDDEFVICELVLLELYMQLRNPALFRKPYSAREAAVYCTILRSNPVWRVVDYDPLVSARLWEWAANTKSGFRQIIDARLAFTLLHHGVTSFATANQKHFAGFGFERVWNPLQ